MPLHITRPCRSSLAAMLIGSVAFTACGGSNDETDSTQASSSTSSGTADPQPGSTSSGDPQPGGGAPASQPAAGTSPPDSASDGTPVAAASGPSATPTPASTPAAAPSAPAPAPAAQSASACAGVTQSALLSAINAARAASRQCGGALRAAVPALSWNAALANAAQRHSTDMATRNFFSHTGSDGSSVGQRVSAAGYRWSSVGENISGGQSSTSAVMSGWLSSVGHCNNIMGASFQEVAVACVSQPGSTYTHYWTMVLARP